MCVTARPGLPGQSLRPPSLLKGPAARRHPQTCPGCPRTAGGPGNPPFLRQQEGSHNGLLEGLGKGGDAQPDGRRRDDEEQEQRVSAVRNLSFRLKRGETLAIVGESGSGKSVTALSLMHLIEQAGGEVSCDEMLLRRRNRQVIELGEQSASQMRHVRGADIAMIFQEPMTSLNPVFTVGEQIAESIRLHQGASHEEAMVEAKRMLDQVRIPEAKAILSRYPHQLSGGMRQRVMIAMALSCRPAVLIADEPTTALDVTIQAQILQLIKVLQQDMSMGVIFITHDMGVVADIADRVLVMYQG